MIATTASSGLKAGFCTLLKLDDVSAFVHSWFKVTAKSPYVLETKEMLGSISCLIVPRLVHTDVV